jgi:hypothetical protein
VCASNQATADKIRQCTPDFSPIVRIPIDNDDDDFQEAAAKSGGKNLDLPEMPSAVKYLGKRYIKGKIEQRFGKGPAEVADKLEKFFSTKAPEEDENPWRYRAISVGVQYGMTEALAYCLPGGVPVYTVMNAAHVVAYGADQLTPVLQKMETAEEVTAWWKYQHDYMGDGAAHLEGIQIAQGFVELAKVPSICLKKIQHQLIDTCSAFADQIHLTDLNVARIACSTLVFIGENSPEALEERVWARAWEDVRRTSMPKSE